MALDKNKIKELLGTGLSNEVVASAVGCASQYITELMGDEKFAAEVVELRTVALAANSARDKKIDSIEDRLIEKLADAVEDNLIYKPRDLLQSFAVLNAAKRRGVPASSNLTINQQVVALVLPAPVVKNFTLSQEGEVIEIDTESKKQTLVTMPAHMLLKQLASRDGSNGDKYETVSRYLPTAHLERKPATGEQAGD